MKLPIKEILIQLQQARPDQSAFRYWLEESATLIAFTVVVGILFTAAAAVVMT